MRSQPYNKPSIGTLAIFWHGDMRHASCFSPGGWTRPNSCCDRSSSSAQAFRRPTTNSGGFSLHAAGSPRQSSNSSPRTIRSGGSLGYHAAQRTADADAALSVLLHHSDGGEFQVAETYAYFGNADKPFEWLNRALTSDPGIIWLRNDPLCVGLTGDPRYPAILKRMNLPTSK